ncbi:MAG: 2,3-bisphosphoglycerate-independent phosphoglycerate mutase [bacterium JZ-2024 1]
MLTWRDWIQPNSTRMCVFIIDGLGGVPQSEGSELEIASPRFLNSLAARSSVGLMHPVAPGWIPGSILGHLSLFGYPPHQFPVRRGPVEVLGAGGTLLPGDLALRGNLCTFSPEGVVTDRRAGRISTEESRALIGMLQQNISEIDRTRVIFLPGREHRFSIVLRGTELWGPIADTDPGVVGQPLQQPRPLSERAFKASNLIRNLNIRVNKLLASHPRANGAVFRGIDNLPEIEPFERRYHTPAAGIASYPVYRGIARLLGMQTLEVTEDPASYATAAQSISSTIRFIYCHWKGTDTAGEDGDFARKVDQIRIADEVVRAVYEAMKPDVLVVTGDHSTPSVLRGHSFHPVPLLIHSSNALPSGVSKFTERECARGNLGILRGEDLLPLTFSHAGYLRKAEF